MTGGAIAAAVTGVAGLGAGTAAAEDCPPPHVSGYSIFKLTETGLGCHHAGELARQIVVHGAPSGWFCARAGHGGMRREWACHKDGSRLRFHYIRH